MTDAKLKDLLRPHLAAAFERGRAAGRAEAGDAFPADSADEPAGERKPLSYYAAAGLGPGHAPRYAGHFRPDPDGTYRGDLHRFFGLTVKAFSDAAKLRRRATAVNGGCRWAWVPRAPAG